MTTNAIAYQHSTSPRPKVRLRGAVTMFLVAAVLFLMMFYGTTHLVAISYLLLLGVINLIPIALARPKHITIFTFILMSPAGLFAFEALFVRLGIGNWDRYLSHTWHPIITENILRKAAILVLFGSVLFWSGYGAPFGRKLAAQFLKRIEHEIQNRDVVVNLPLAYTIFAIGITVRLYMVRAGIGGYFSDASLRQSVLSYIQYLLLLDQLGNVALLAIFAHHLKKNTTNWLFVMMCIVDIGTALLLGFKGQILYRFFYLLVVYVSIRSVPSKRLMIIAVAVFISIYPLVEGMRASWNRGKINTGSVLQLSSEYFDQSQYNFGSTPVQNVQKSLNSISRHFGQMQAFAAIIAYFDATGNYFYGQEYTQIFTTFIPRALWSTKPSINLGGWIYTTVYGYAEGTAETPTVPGDFYLNFGITGLLAGMFVMGVILRIVGDIIPRITSLRYIPLVPFIILQFGEPGGLLGPHLAGVIRFYPIYILVMRILIPSGRS